MTTAITFLIILMSCFAIHITNSVEALNLIYPQMNTFRLFARDAHSKLNDRLTNVRPPSWSYPNTLQDSSTSLNAAMKFKNFEEMLMTCGDSLVIVTFSTNLCGSCRSMKKELGEVSSLIGGEVKMFSIDMDKFPKLGTRYGVEILPTVVIFKGGEVFDRIEGVESADKVIARLSTYL
mmetsp:Transcript_14227/g.21030  ORF Transcript_14227/g.21030 Transcript_14227/m.21030 type:complete len:178 (+) Transcript_14227:88-621(+)